MGKNVLKFPGEVLGYPSILFRLLIALILIVGAMSIDTEEIKIDALKRVTMQKPPSRNLWNISQTEYETKHRAFFELVEMNQRKRLNSSSNYDEENIVRKKLYTFTHSGLKNSPLQQGGEMNLNYKIHIPEVDNRRIEVEEKSLRFLTVPKNCATKNQNLSFRVRITNEERLRHQEEFVLDSCLPKWIGLELVDVSLPHLSTVLNLTVHCKECQQQNIDFTEPYLNIIVNEKSRVRRRREKKRKRNGGTGPEGRRRCFRRKWDVDLSKIRGYYYVMQPRVYDAGLCLGRCTNVKHFQTQHAHIQYLLSLTNDSIPKPCCTPSKMQDMELLYSDAEDPDKLHLTIWKDSKVTECACQ